MSRRVSLIPLGSVFGRPTEWCKERHVNYHTAVARIKRGWNIDRLFDPPVAHVNESGMGGAQ